MSRRVGGDDVEVTRSRPARRVRRGVPGLPGRPGAAGLQQLDAGHRAVAGSSCWTRTSSRRMMRDWFPMAVHLLEGLFFGIQNIQQAGRPAGAAARAGLAVGRPDPRAEQPGRRRGAGHRRRCATGSPACGTSWRMIAAGQLDQHGAGDAGPAAGGGGGAGGQGARADPDGGLRPRGRARRLARRPRRRRRLGAGADVRPGRARRRLAGPGGGGRRRRHPGGRRPLAELHGRDRAADERDRGLDHAGLDAWSARPSSTRSWTGRRSR